MTVSRSRSRLAAVVVAIMIAATPAGGGQVESTIVGTVRDGSGAPLPGASVTAVTRERPDTSRTAATNDHGGYRLRGLPPGIYELTAIASGNQAVRREDLRVPVGTTLTIDFRLDRARGPDPLTIHDVGPVVDVTSPSLTVQFGREELENLPVGDLIALAPGVTRRSSLGSGPDTDQLTVDGSATVLTYRAGTAGVSLVPYWIEEAQVVSAGADAAWGEFSGVVGHVVLRSGSNRPSGHLEYRTTPSTWVADNTSGLPEELRDQFRPAEVLSRWSTIGQLGGPIWRDKLYFFAGYRHVTDKTLRAGTLGDVPTQVRLPSFLTRLNARLSSRVALQGFVHREAAHSKGTLGRNQLPETAGAADTRVHSWNSRLTWNATSTFVELLTNGLDFNLANLPGARRQGPPSRTDRITQIRSGNAPTYGDETARRVLAGVRMTRLIEGRLGRGHEIQLGLEHDRLRFHSLSGIPGGRAFTDAAGVPEQVRLWDGSMVDSSGGRTVLYVQDGWRVADRVSIDAGVRLARNRGAVPDRGRVFETSPVSPRIGMAWDVGADHRTVVRGGYSRLHEGMYPSVFDSLDTSGQSPSIIARVLGPETFQELNRTAIDTVALDENVAHAFADQFLAGLEREVATSVSVKAQYIRRHFKDIWAFIDVGSRYAAVQRTDPGPDGRLATTDDGPAVTVFNLLNPGQSAPVLTNPDGAYRRYDGVQLIGEKHISRHWQLLGAYTWSRTRGSVNNANAENRAAGGDTARGGSFFNPNRAINQEGRTAADQRHQAIVQGTAQVPVLGGLIVSGSYRYSSGAPWGRVAVITGLSQGNQPVRAEPRGTRELAATAVVDLRVEKIVGLGGARRASIAVDLFNLTNTGVAVAVQEVSGAAFGQPTQWSAARTGQLVARFRF